MAKLLIMTIQVNLCFTLHRIWDQIHVIKILPLAYHHSHFQPTLDVTSFPQWPSSGPCTFFTAGL